MLAAYFCHSRKSHLEYNCALIKVDLLTTCIALRVVGAVLVIFLWPIEFAQYSCQWEARAT